MRRISCLLVTLLVTLVTLPAHAGRRAYLIGYDQPHVPDGDVEVETWLDFILRSRDSNQWRWWLGPRWAPHETIEIAAFTIVAQDYTSPKVEGAELWAEQIDVRWRFFSHPRAGSLTLQLNTRIAIVNDMAHQMSPQLGWATRVGRFGFTAQVGYAAGFAAPTDAGNYHWIVWNAGASVDVVRGQVSPPLQLGFEAFGQGVIAGHNDFTDIAGSTVNLGPTLAAAKGRLWLTAGTLFGVTAASPFLFTRVVIGVAL